MSRIATFILNPLIVLGFVVATIVFFWGIIELIAKADDTDLAKSKRNVMYGVIGMFVMFSVFGILRLVLGTLGIPCQGFFC